MRLSCQHVGKLIRDLRLKRDIGQKEVVSALPFHYSIRSLGRVESGERRPSRATLIAILTSGMKLTDADTVNRLLRAADYVGLTTEEARHHRLSASSATIMMS